MDKPISLLNLPLELIRAILSVIRFSAGTLKALAQSCRCLNTIVTPFLYKLVVIWSPESMNQFIETAAKSQHLISLVQELQIHYHDLDEESEDSPEDIEPALSDLVSLESLVIRSSWYTERKAEKMELSFNPQGKLPALRSCILSVNDGRDWSFDIGSWGFIFHHPNLERLTIAGAAFHIWETPIGRDTPLRSTCLQELTLLNCNISAKHLKSMLCYPHQLKRFTMKGDSCHPPNGIHADINRQLYIDALKSHSLSLEILDVEIRFRKKLHGYREWREPIDLRDFLALETLTIAPKTLIGDDGYLWPKSASALEWVQFLPPNLQHLEIRNVDCAVFPISQFYEALRKGYIHLSAFACQIASNVWEDGYLCCHQRDATLVTPEGTPVFPSPNDLMTDTSPDGVSYFEGFRRLGVEFSVYETCHSKFLPEYDSCPCDCWYFNDLFECDPPSRL